MKLSNIQLLRALAVLAVVFHHVNDALVTSQAEWIFHDWQFLGQSGAFGVDLFFLISGFIMVHVGGAGFPSLRQASAFLARRMFRIYPAYWVVTLLATALWISGLGFRSVEGGMVYILLSFLCLPMSTHPIVGQGWTLSFELYFYLVFAVVSRVFRTPVGFLAATLFWFALGNLMGRFTSWALVRDFLGSPLLFEFWAGACVGHLHRRGLIPISIPLGSAFLVSGICGLAATAYFGIDWTSRVWAWGGPSLLLLLGAVALPQSNWSGWRPWHILGDASYSIYLVHAFVFLALPKVVSLGQGMGDHGNLLGAGTILACIGLGLGYWRWIESPLQRWTATVIPRGR